MRAVEFNEYGPADVVHVTEVPEPHAGPGEIRIAVRASGVVTGDTRIRSGALRDVVPVVFPYRTGFDAAGVVDEIGDGVTGVGIGDEVFGAADPRRRGANADFTVLTAWSAKPASWTWEESAGAAGAIETSTRVLDRLGVGAGQTVLVQGAAGGTGAVAVQIAVARGAVVIGTAREHNHDFLRSLGVVPTTYGPGLVERVHALAPDGVDAVFDCAGGALPDLIAITGDPARVVTIADITAKSHGVHMSHGAVAAEPGGPVGAADPVAWHGLAMAVAFAAEGRLRIPVAASFPIEDVVAAHRLAGSRHAPGKIVLTH
ncbi:NADP-dependent oxidoreductase [Herbidospora sp. RD11066]